LSWADLVPAYLLMYVLTSIWNEISWVWEVISSKG
jgi:hypothetical protein